MVYELKLRPRNYNRIKNKLKTIEMRVYKDKYRSIKIGDQIRFINEGNNKSLICDVINLYRYDSFNELYKHHSKEEIGYYSNETAIPNDMLSYYSKDIIEQNGVVGIEIRVIKK